MSKKGTFININYNTNTVIKMTFKEIPKEIQTPVMQPIVFDPTVANGAITTLTNANQALVSSDFYSGPMGASTAQTAARNAQSYLTGPVAPKFEKLLTSL